MVLFRLVFFCRDIFNLNIDKEFQRLNNLSFLWIIRIHKKIWLELFCWLKHFIVWNERGRWDIPSMVVVYKQQTTISHWITLLYKMLCWSSLQRFLWMKILTILNCVIIRWIKCRWLHFSHSQFQPDSPNPLFSRWVWSLNELTCCDSRVVFFLSVGEWTVYMRFVCRFVSLWCFFLAVHSIH